MIHDMSINQDQVRSLREARGWSQEHLAEVSGLSLRTIQRVEAEGRGSRETKLSLAAAFDVPLGRLCAGSPAAAVPQGEGQGAWVTLMGVGTLILIVGLFAGLNPVLLVTGTAFLLGALALYGLGQLNGMRRAAGLKPLMPYPTAESGLAVLVTGTAVVVLGYAVSDRLWWMPGGVLMLFGVVFMLWPLILRRLTGSKAADPGTPS